MIHKIDCVTLECDNCKEDYESFVGYTIFVDYSSLKEHASDDGWELSHEGKQYCDKCHYYNDNDEFVLNSERTKISAKTTTNTCNHEFVIVDIQWEKCSHCGQIQPITKI